MRSAGTLIESFCTGTFCFVFIVLGRIYKVMTVIEALNKLKLAGLPDKQAEAIVETFEQRDRSWFETQFEKLRTEIEKVRAELRSEESRIALAARAAPFGLNVYVTRQACVGWGYELADGCAQ